MQRKRLQLSGRGAQEFVAIDLLEQFLETLRMHGSIWPEFNLVQTGASGTPEPGTLDLKLTKTVYPYGPDRPRGRHPEPRSSPALRRISHGNAASHKKSSCTTF